MPLNQKGEETTRISFPFSGSSQSLSLSLEGNICFPFVVVVILSFHPTMYNRRGGFGSSHRGGFGGSGGYDRPDYSTVAPPSNLNKRVKYSSDEQTNVDLASTVARQKRVRLDDDYFEDDDQEEEVSTEPKTTVDGDGDDGDDDDEDPLDAFMAGLEKESTSKPSSKPAASTSRTTAQPMSSKKPMKETKGVRGDIDEEDHEESYYKYMAANPTAGINTLAGDSEDEEYDASAAGQRVEYDADGNPIYVRGPNVIDPLPPIDHTTIKYEPFNKNFYEEHAEIATLNHQQVHELRSKLGIRIFGSNAPKPICSFGHFGFDDQLMKAIIKSEFTSPTPIQAQGIPVALSGRDLIGIAKTGSGKTAAYLWPLIVHIMDQRDLKLGEGPIGLILAPTRELSQQIYTEAKRFGKVYNINVVCAYGGGNKWEQCQDLAAGAEIVVATPGRMIDLIKCKATNLERVTCLILDEADRMFDMGFEPQVRSICNHVRPDRQTMLFSATFKKKIERLARDVLTDPIKIVQGEGYGGEANESVIQNVLMFDDPPQKWDWLMSKLVEFLSQGSILIFVTKKANSEELAENLKVREHQVLLIHGDMDQAERNRAITAFKRKEAPILVATDVAARGLDIPHIRTVVNYDVARDIDTHTHRIGRTGRAGEKGYAYTLVTEKDKEFAGHLVRNLEGANQDVPENLLSLAMKSKWFKDSRFRQQRGPERRNINSGERFRHRPGFGSSAVSHTSSSSQLSSFVPPQTSSSTSQPSSSSSSLSQATSDRVAAIRSNYAAQYKNMFKPATDTWSSRDISTANQQADDAPRKKSRWN